MSFIGIDLGGTKISGGLVSNSKLVKTAYEKINSKGNEKEVLAQITQLIDELVDKKVRGIGIGVPAIVDVDKGIVFETVNIPSWKNVPLKRILERKYGVPVFVNNDANCFALGEKYFGKGKKYQHIVAITLGTGVGAGIIINGKLYAGHNCGAGELGEAPFLDKRIESYCSGKYFLKQHGISGEELYQKALQRDPNAIDLFKIFGHNLGKALAMVVHTIDPEAIILGGSISKAYRFFEKSMKQSLQESTYQRSYSRLKIYVSKEANIAVIGAASLCYDSLK